MNERRNHPKKNRTKKKKATHTQQALNAHPAGNPLVCCTRLLPVVVPPPFAPPPPPPPPVGAVGKFVPVKLYTFSALGPPQNSDPLPWHGMLHAEAACGAPPLMTAVLQTGFFFGRCCVLLVGLFS